MRVGITGGSGFLGSYILEQCSETSDMTYKAITRTMSISKRKEAKNVQWCTGDLNSIRTCKEFIRDVDVVIHLAHTNSPADSNYDLPGDALANVLPTVNLIQATKEEQRKLHFVYSSSGGAIYGERNRRQLLQENHVCRPDTAYGIQKLLGEHYFRMAASNGWLTATCLRIGNAYGRVLPPQRRQGLIGVAIAQILNEKPVKIFGRPSNVRDYIHLSDIYHAFGKTLVPERAFDVFNIGGGKGYSVEEVLRLLENCLGRKIRTMYLEPDPRLSKLPAWSVLDIRKAKRVIGWEPTIELEDGLRELHERLKLKG